MDQSIFGKLIRLALQVVFDSTTELIDQYGMQSISILDSVANIVYDNAFISIIRLKVIQFVKYLINIAFSWIL